MVVNNHDDPPELGHVIKMVKKRFLNLFSTAADKTRFDRSQRYREFQLSLKPFVLSKSYIKPDMSHPDFIVDAVTFAARRLWSAPTDMSDDRALEFTVKQAVDEAWTSWSQRERARASVAQKGGDVDENGEDNDDDKEEEEDVQEEEEEGQNGGGLDEVDEEEEGQNGGGLDEVDEEDKVANETTMADVNMSIHETTMADSVNKSIEDLATLVSSTQNKQPLTENNSNNNTRLSLKRTARDESSGRKITEYMKFLSPDECRTIIQVAEDVGKPDRGNNDSFVLDGREYQSNELINEIFEIAKSLLAHPPSSDKDILRLYVSSLDEEKVDDGEDDRLPPVLEIYLGEKTIEQVNTEPEKEPETDIGKAFCYVVNDEEDDGSNESDFFDDSGRTDDDMIGSKKPKQWICRVQIEGNNKLTTQCESVGDDDGEDKKDIDEEMSYLFDPVLKEKDDGEDVDYVIMGGGEKSVDSPKMTEVETQAATTTIEVESPAAATIDVEPQQTNSKKSWLKFLLAKQNESKLTVDKKKT